MLIDKGVTEGEVVTLKLSTGEELIAKLIEDGVLYYKLSKPMVLSMTQKGVGMMPYLFTVNPDKEIKLFKTNVVVMEVTDKDFATAYTQQTTGIALA
jgi:hypothetical protein